MKWFCVLAAAALFAGCGGDGGGAGTTAGNNTITGDLAFTIASVAPGSGGGSDGSCEHDSAIVVFDDSCEGGANGTELRISEDFTKGGAAKPGTFDITGFDCGTGTAVASVHYTAFFPDGGAEFLDAASGSVTVDSIGTAAGGYPSMTGKYEATFPDGRTAKGTFDTTNADGCF